MGGQGTERDSAPLNLEGAAEQLRQRLGLMTLPASICTPSPPLKTLPSQSLLGTWCELCKRGHLPSSIGRSKDSWFTERDDAADPQNKLWRGRWGRGKKERAKGGKEVGEEKRKKGKVDPKRKKACLVANHFAVPLRTSALTALCALYR